MKEKILQILSDLRSYALNKGYDISLLYHEEDSSLMRFANSAISLNTREHLIRLMITAYEGRKRAEYDLITDLSKVDEMKAGIDTAAEMVKHAMPLTYEPTVTVFKETFADELAFDAGLACMSNEEKLSYFNSIVEGLETDDLKLAGILSSGQTVLAQINTRSEHSQYFSMTDAQTTAVLAHSKLKWEVLAEQSAQKKTELDPSPLNRELAYLVKRYQEDTPQQIPLGKYDIVFGPAATADMINFMRLIAYNGGVMKRGYSFLSEEQVGHQVFSEHFTLADDPGQLVTFPFKRDLTGMERTRCVLFKQGYFQGYVYSQDDADEFGAKATGHTVMHQSQVVDGGDREVKTLEDLAKLRRERDLLYIPYLHYMNIVNPSKGIVTASSRFGALLLKKDGSIAVPYNVRLTQSLLDIFGERVAWMSRQTVAYNTSMSYGARNPTAIVVPQFMQVNDLEISHSNTSY